MPLDDTAVAVSPVGVDGAVLSGAGACVVALALADAPERFPEVSTALTVYEYAVDPVSPVSLYEFVPEEPTCTPPRKIW